MRLELNVNGRPVVREIAPQELLLDVLRDRLGLTGAKRSCDMQVCGACTVLVDGRPVSSCCFLAADAEGASVLTIEGLAERPEFARLEEAFTRHAALQCGFCTPGMLLTVTALLETGELTSEAGGQAQPGRQPLPLHRLPRRSSRRSATSPGCRVSGRRRRGPAPAWSASPSRGATRTRSSAARRSSPATSSSRACCTGRCCARPYRARADRLRSTRRRPRRCPASSASSRPPISRDIDPYWGHAIRDRPVVAIDRVRFAGEPVAAVAAEDEATADGGARADRRRVRGAAGRRHGRGGARRRTRRWSTTGRSARGSSTGSASCPQRDGNVCYRYRIDRGEIEAVFAHAEHRRRGRVHVPGRLPVRDGDAHRRRPGRGGRDHAVGVLPAPVPRPRRDRRALRGADRERPHHRPVPGRRLRLEVVHEDGADHGRARAQGRPAGADPEPRRRVDGDDAPPRHDAAGCARR